MTPHFADTFYFIAILNPRDEAHPRATALGSQMHNPLVTTAWILTEVADALAQPPSRELFGRLLSHLRTDPRSTIIPPSDELFQRGIDFYLQREDKQWSLTDCISFVVMRDQNLTEALTGDHHFEQAGFIALLK